MTYSEVPMAANNPICIVDFCGYYEPGHFPLQFWAFWFPAEAIVKFGGDWGVDDLADMPASCEPAEDEVYAWARSHGSDI